MVADKYRVHDVGVIPKLVLRGSIFSSRVEDTLFEVGLNAPALNSEVCSYIALRESRFILNFFGSLKKAQERCALRLVLLCLRSSNVSLPATAALDAFRTLSLPSKNLLSPICPDNLRVICLQSGRRFVRIRRSG